MHTPRRVCTPPPASPEHWRWPQRATRPQTSCVSTNATVATSAPDRRAAVAQSPAPGYPARARRSLPSEGRYAPESRLPATDRRVAAGPKSTLHGLLSCRCELTDHIAQGQPGRSVGARPRGRIRAQHHPADSTMSNRLDRAVAHRSRGPVPAQETSGPTRRDGRHQSHWQRDSRSSRDRAHPEKPRLDRQSQSVPPANPAAVATLDSPQHTAQFTQTPTEGILSASHTLESPLYTAQSLKAAAFHSR